jgi:AMMECR1 domain-containing protein
MEPAEKAPYSTVEQAKIISLARDVLAKLFAGRTTSELQDDADLLGIAPADRVNITLRHGGRIRGSMSAPGSNLGRQIVQAAYRAAMDRRFGGPLTRSEVSDTTLEVWIQIGSEEISPDSRFKENVLLLGIEGLEIQGYGKSAYYKPSVAITGRHKTAIALFEALCKKAGLEKDAWQDSAVRLRKTQWLCLHNISKTHPFGLEHDAETTAAIPLNTWIAESAHYLVRNQDANGDTAYLYDPIADVFLPEAIHLVRAAGCLYALSQVLQSSHEIALDKMFRTAAIQMARGLVCRTSITDDGGRLVLEKRIEEPPKVGATALVAAALGAGILGENFAQEYKQLYRSITRAQKPDGRFITRFGEAEERERETNFYSGQALLALALEAERGNREAEEMCRLAFQPYLLHFRTAPTSAFVGWHVDVWSRMALLTGEHAYAEFAFEQTEWLLQMQVESHNDPRWVGGFSRSGAPKFSSIVFLEATVRALILAIRTGDAERTRRYTERVRLGLQFCRLLRLEETPSILLGNPMRCKGGVALGLVDRRVRCDVVQHFITLCLAVEQIKEYLP